MVCVLDSGSSDPGFVLCSWARHFTLTASPSTQVYKWVLANLMLGGGGGGGTRKWASILSRGSSNTPCTLMLQETGVKRRMGTRFERRLYFYLAMALHALCHSLQSNNVK